MHGGATISDISNQSCWPKSLNLDILQIKLAYMIKMIASNNLVKKLDIIWRYGINNKSN